MSKKVSQIGGHFWVLYFKLESSIKLDAFKIKYRVLLIKVHNAQKVAHTG